MHERFIGKYSLQHQTVAEAQKAKMRHFGENANTATNDKTVPDILEALTWDVSTSSQFQQPSGMPQHPYCTFSLSKTVYKQISTVTFHTSVPAFTCIT